MGTPRVLALALLAVLALAWAWVALRPAPAGGGESCLPDPRFDRASILAFSGGMPEVPRYSNALSIPEIEALRGDVPLPRAQRIPGLTLADYGLHARYRVSSARRPFSRRACVWLESLEASLDYACLEVFIAREYAPGTCEYAEIATHESLHVAVHREAAAEFRAELEKAFRAATALPTRANPMSAAGAEEGERTVARLVDAVLAPLRARFAEELALRQAQLDTAQAYRDIQARCRGWR